MRNYQRIVKTFLKFAEHVVTFLCLLSIPVKLMLATVKCPVITLSCSNFREAFSNSREKAGITVQDSVLFN